MDFFPSGRDIPSEEAYFGLAKQQPVMTHRQMLQVATMRDQAVASGQVVEAEQCIRRMVLSNMLLVGTPAYKCVAILHPLEGIQLGYEGLLKAARRFKWEVGARFTTYAVKVIRSAVATGLLQAKSSESGVKAYRWDEWKKVQTAEAALIQRLHGREPSVEEVAKETGFTPKHTRLLYRLFGPPTELNEQLDQGGSTLWGGGKNFHELNPEQVALLEDRLTWAHQTLDLANSRAAEYLRRRWGVDSPSGEEESAEQIGLSVGVGDERVNQVMKESRRGEILPALNRLGVTAEILEDE